jgi:hypothetical protein
VAPLRATPPDVRALQHLPEPPQVEKAPAGRVLVTVEWRVPAESAIAFVEAMRPVGRRAGARGSAVGDHVQDR